MPPATLPVAVIVVEPAIAPEAVTVTVVTSPAVVKLPPATLPVAVIVVPPTMALVESILSAFTCPAVVMFPPATLPVAVSVVLNVPDVAPVIAPAPA